MYDHGYHPTGTTFLDYVTWAGVALLALVVLVSLLSTAWRVNQSYEQSVVFRLGRVSRVRHGGPYLILPFLERTVKVDMRTITTTFQGQEMVTQDGLAITVDAVAWYRATDALKAVTTVANWQNALLQSAETTIRDVVGRHRMTEILRDRSPINAEMQSLLASTAQWGTLVEKIEIKNLDLPEGMQRAIAREAEAHREAAARVIKAEGEFEASKKLKAAAETMRDDPIALQLRNLQTISEVGAEKNSVIMALPLEAIESGKAAALAAAAMPHITR